MKLNTALAVILAVSSGLVAAANEKSEIRKPETPGKSEVAKLRQYEKADLKVKIVRSTVKSATSVRTDEPADSDVHRARVK